jgi:hypothetical protein
MYVKKVVAYYDKPAKMATGAGVLQGLCTDRARACEVTVRLHTPRRRKRACVLRLSNTKPLLWPFDSFASFISPPSLVSLIQL